jgi:DNA-binding winged helix-turn-helix (wHTH) protein
MAIRFGAFVLDRATRLLRENGEVRPLEPKAFALLELLVERRPAAVSKQEIRDRIWPRTFVADSTLSSLAAQVRRALGRGAFLRTVHSFGYAFAAEAEEAEADRPSPAVGRLEWDGGACRLAAGENFVGRGREADVRVDAPGVSRRHARVVVDGGRFTIEDLGSKNGTFLAGRRLKEPAPLSDGDELRLGRTILVFRLAGDTTVTED